MIALGTPLRTSIELSMRGQIRLGTWRDFTAVQRLAPGRGIRLGRDRPDVRPADHRIDRYSRYTRGTGETRWKMLGRIPVLSGAGPDVTRSAADRYAGELLVVVPAAALSPHVSWLAVDADRATARIRVGAGQHDVTLTVSATGELTSLSTERWGATGKGSFAERPFTADFTGEVTFGGVTLPKEIASRLGPGPVHPLHHRDRRAPVDHRLIQVPLSRRGPDAAGCQRPRGAGEADVVAGEHRRLDAQRGGQRP